MAAGAWFDWNTGDLVTEARFQDIQDSIAFIYASESAANTALTNKVEGTQFYDTTNDVLKIWDGSAWQSVGGGGLVYINSGTFSSVSTLTVSNVFSSTYQNYKIIIEITDNSNDNCGTTFRLYDGSEITANYISQRFQGEDSTAEVVKSPDGTDEWTCVPIDQTYAYGGFIQVLLNSPQQATATHFSLQGDGTFDSNTLYSTANSGVHTGTDQATGFAFKVSAGTFDGNWAVYGFAES